MTRTPWPGLRPAWVEVDLEAIAGNVRTLAAEVAPARLLAVVKADAYGHGAVPVARAAVRAGAAWLGVALVEEAQELRRAGISAPVLVLSEPHPAAADACAADQVAVTLCTREGVAAFGMAGRRAGRAVTAHLKVDTGMHRVGVWPPGAAVGLIERAAAVGLELEGLWTHLACADSDEVTTKRQLDAFAQVIKQVRGAGYAPRLLHVANTAGAIGFPRARLDMVRVGIGIYGVQPAPGIGAGLGLQPALTWRSAVAFVKRLTAGTRVSYGHHHELERDSWVATVPVGYSDGYPRMLSSRADVLVGGRRCRVAGSVTMDQLIVDCGELEPAVGDEVVLLGAQGAETVTAWELAGHAGTIAYEVLARVGTRVPRRHHSGGGP